MSRESKSVNQRMGRYVQGGTSEQYADRLGWWERRKIEHDDSDMYVVISKKAEFRPDAISYRIYGTDYYAWLVMEYNSIVDQLELKQGTTIRLPTPRRLNIGILNRSSGSNVRNI